MRSIPASLDPAVVSGIDGRIAEVSAAHGVRIPWAIESGSRAWGFPSPDSDYDCRFLFVRPLEDYLRLEPLRDVIETPLDEVFDVNGWDLRKALTLLVRGNATVTEWLCSPIVYGGDAGFRDGLLAVAERVLDRERIIDHYQHVGDRNLATTGGRLKRFFSALRPAAALLWLRSHPGAAVPPMDLPTLLAETEPPPGVAEATAELIRAKAVTRELGTAEPPEVLHRFIVAELETAESRVRAEPADRARALAIADEHFIALVGAADYRSS